MKDVRRLVLIALLSGIAVVIYAAESFIPTPSPWLRFGFSHMFSQLILAQLARNRMTCHK